MKNMIFLMNVVDYLAGDQDLISLRSREVTSRPLDILQLDTEDEQRFSADEKERMVDRKKEKMEICKYGATFNSHNWIWRITVSKRKKNQAEVLKQIYD